MFERSMDIGTDHCYAGVPLALRRSLTQGTYGCVEAVVSRINCLLAGRMPCERRGERILIQASVTACRV